MGTPTEGAWRESIGTNGDTLTKSWNSEIQRGRPGGKHANRETGFKNHDMTQRQDLLHQKRRRNFKNQSSSLMRACQADHMSMNPRWVSESPVEVYQTPKHLLNKRLSIQTRGFEDLLFGKQDLHSRLSSQWKRSVVSDSLWPHGLYSPWNSPGKNTAVGSLSLLQGIFPT